MDVTITPSVPTGSVKAPPGKSMAHRLLIAAGLCAGTSTVRGVSLSEDVLATIDCLRALGAEVGILEETGGEPFPAEAKAPAVRMLPAEEKIILVRGTDPARAKAACLPCRESGSTLRFFAPLCMLSGEKMRLEGSRTLLGRPLFVYEEICREQKILFQKEDPACAAQIYSEQEILFQKGDPACAAPGGALEDQGSLVPGGALAGQGNPAPGGALLVQGNLAPGDYVLDGNVSSQFVTGLLFALPLLEKASTLSLRPPVESRPYIDMTMAALRRFGVETAWEGAARIRIPGGQRYLPQDIRVEGDWSNAAFFLALGVPVTGLAADSLQGDRVCVEYFRALDQGPAELSLADCPDLGPVLFAYAALHHGGTFTDTRRLRIKESDRGAAMQEELRKFGIRMEVLDNRISVGSGVRPPQEPLYGHNDHRIVMALAVLCVKIGGTICGAQAVRKSFPDFFRRLRNLGIRAEETEP